MSCLLSLTHKQHFASIQFNYVYFYARKICILAQRSARATDCAHMQIARACVARTQLGHTSTSKALTSFANKAAARVLLKNERRIVRPSSLVAFDSRASSGHCCDSCGCVIDASDSRAHTHTHVNTCTVPRCQGRAQPSKRRLRRRSIRCKRS